VTGTDESNSDSDSDTTRSKSDAESTDNSDDIPTDLSTQQKHEQNEKATPAFGQTNEEVNELSLQKDTNISVTNSDDSSLTSTTTTSNVLNSSKRLLRTTSKANPIIRETPPSDAPET
jgi:hypothetical protein